MADSIVPIVMAIPAIHWFLAVGSIDFNAMAGQIARPEFWAAIGLILGAGAFGGLTHGLSSHYTLGGRRASKPATGAAAAPHAHKAPSEAAAEKTPEKKTTSRPINWGALIAHMFVGATAAISVLVFVNPNPSDPLMVTGICVLAGWGGTVLLRTLQTQLEAQTAAMEQARQDAQEAHAQATQALAVLAAQSGGAPQPQMNQPGSLASDMGSGNAAVGGVTGDGVRVTAPIGSAPPISAPPEIVPVAGGPPLPSISAPSQPPTPTMPGASVDAEREPAPARTPLAAEPQSDSHPDTAPQGNTQPATEPQGGAHPGTGPARHPDGASLVPEAGPPAGTGAVPQASPTTMAAHGSPEAVDSLPILLDVLPINLVDFSPRAAPETPQATASQPPAAPDAGVADTDEYLTSYPEEQTRPSGGPDSGPSWG